MCKNYIHQSRREAWYEEAESAKSRHVTRGQHLSQYLGPASEMQRNGQVGCSYSYIASRKQNTRSRSTLLNSLQQENTNQTIAYVWTVLECIAWKFTDGSADGEGVMSSPVGSGAQPQRKTNWVGPYDYLPKGNWQQRLRKLSSVTLALPLHYGAGVLSRTERWESDGPNTHLWINRQGQNAS